MSDLIFFQSTREITRPDWIRTAREQFALKEILWGNDDRDELIKGGGEPSAYIEVTQSGGAFPFCYNVYLKNLPAPLTKRNEIDFMVVLARAFDAELLTDEESVNPYLFIHVTAETISTVDIQTEPYDDRDELFIEDYFNPVFGSFSTETALTGDEQSVLIELLKEFLPECELLPVNVDIISQFSEARKRISALQNYHQFYFIQPLGKCPWYSVDERSAHLVRMMTLFHDQTKRNVCYLPANATRTQNIPGGSDSESFCVNLTAAGAEKIIYKPLRERW